MAAKYWTAYQKRNQDKNDQKNFTVPSVFAISVCLSVCLSACVSVSALQVTVFVEEKIFGVRGPWCNSQKFFFCFLKFWFWPTYGYFKTFLEFFFFFIFSVNFKRVCRSNWMTWRYEIWNIGSSYNHLLSSLIIFHILKVASGFVAKTEIATKKIINITVISLWSCFYHDGLFGRYLAIPWFVNRIFDFWPTYSYS